MAEYGDDRLPIRFWAKVHPEPNSGCWLWSAALGGFENTYGKFGWQGASRYAHRISYEQLVGEIPEGLEVDHLCRTRLCVNPAHLEPVTPGVNQRRAGDAIERCPAGHLRSVSGVYEDRQGHKKCKDCVQARVKARYERIKTHGAQHHTRAGVPGQSGSSGAEMVA